MKIKKLLTAVTASFSSSRSVLMAQTLANKYAQSVHAQAKVGVETIKPWHKGYQQEVKPWSKLSSHGLKGMLRMYNHGIKRV
jgi:hypothetical protein